MDIQSAIRAVMAGKNLDKPEMTAVMRTIMGGEATPAQIAGFLVGLQMKGETVEEIAGAAAVMRELATRVDVDSAPLIDTCGTGGDAKGTFNVSTAAAFVVAAAEGHVAKHGNRSVSSSSGSADVLEAAGAHLDLNPDEVAQAISEIGVGFLFAPKHHSAMRHAVGPRKEMGVRTLFNLLGPLTNPASAPHQVLGVYHDRWVRPVAEVLQDLGSRQVMVVHAEDGLDEISVSAPTHVAELKNGEVQEYTIKPDDFGIEPSSLDDIRVDTARQSLALMRHAFDGERGPAADIIALNAGAAIYTAGLTDTLKDGVARARDVLSRGSANERMAEFVVFTSNFPG